MAAELWDAIVVGAGQAGPALAVRLAQAGYRTALVARERVGGTCVHTGGWLQRTERMSIVPGHARFTRTGTLAVSDRELTAPKIFLNVGCRPLVPAWVREAGVPYLTSDNLFDLQELPGHLAGYAAAPARHARPDRDRT
jgi:pyruvate/2-oxoglutarate dehydrogenase complex dihydrolipoamide dehydrogenase (E3) component